MIPGVCNKKTLTAVVLSMPISHNVSNNTLYSINQVSLTFHKSEMWKEVERWTPSLQALQREYHTSQGFSSKPDAWNPCLAAAITCRRKEGEGEHNESATVAAAGCEASLVAALRVFFLWCFRSTSNR